ncbi:hypothetical protein ACIOD0_22550 [Kitasatospora albolonga]|uniref:hypothetical protein n=1 Tax=Streptomyces sp. NPDC057552 TaxID=3350537 RepID=UPI0036832DE2
MSIRRTTTTRRALTAVTVTAALALALTGCGDDGGEGPRSEGSNPPSAPVSPSAPEDKGEPQQQDTAAGENVDPNVKLAEARGQAGVTLVVNQVQRDSGGFVTVQAEIKNEGTTLVNPAQWAGTESVIVRQNLSSVGGATLVDKVGKKRYYVLRDTDGRCLCTTKIRPLQPGTSTAVFMQFPAPPSTTTEVDFSLPTFATTSLKISG